MWLSIGKTKRKNLTREEMRAISLEAQAQALERYDLFIERKAQQVMRRISQHKFRTNKDGYLITVIFGLDFDDARAVCNRLGQEGFSNVKWETSDNMFYALFDSCDIWVKP